MTARRGESLSASVHLLIAAILLRINTCKNVGWQSTGDLKIEGLALRVGPFSTDALLDGTDYGRVFLMRSTIFLCLRSDGFRDRTNVGSARRHSAEWRQSITGPTLTSTGAQAGIGAASGSEIHVGLTAFKLLYLRDDWQHADLAASASWQCRMRCTRWRMQMARLEISSRARQRGLRVPIGAGLWIFTNSNCFWRSWTRPV